jgi:hypothetical protein
MENNKPRGPDGFLAEFYQNLSDNIKPDLQSSPTSLGELISNCWVGDALTIVALEVFGGKKREEADED